MLLTFHVTDPKKPEAEAHKPVDVHHYLPQWMEGQQAQLLLRLQVDYRLRPQFNACFTQAPRLPTYCSTVHQRIIEQWAESTYAPICV